MTLPVDRIGIMQGRLLPPVGGRIQAFPGAPWPDEFDRAAEIGFGAIEFIFDGDPIAHPLCTRSGVEAIRSAIARTGVAVDAVCADYFMSHPFHGAPARELDAAVDLLHALLGSCAEIGVHALVIPCVDASTLRGAANAEGLVSAMRAAARAARRGGVAIALETDLAPAPFAALLTRMPDDIGVNYDMGNSASLGFDPGEEFDAYGPRIVSVHVKDRPRRGSTVLLGSGDTDFAQCFELLERAAYRGPLTIQGARGADDVATAQAYLEFVRPYVAVHQEVRPSTSG